MEAILEIEEELPEYCLSYKNSGVTHIIPEDEMIQKSLKITNYSKNANNYLIKISNLKFYGNDPEITIYQT